MALLALEIVIYRGFEPITELPRWHKAAPEGRGPLVFP
jgi:hypothetical protein